MLASLPSSDLESETCLLGNPDSAKKQHALGKNAASAAFLELQERGFLVITKRSAFSLKNKTATE